jgi:N-acetylmuramic acid 6-phosphate (MurNAc-6-P) etherase
MNKVLTMITTGKTLKTASINLESNLKLYRRITDNIKAATHIPMSKAKISHLGMLLE